MGLPGGYIAALFYRFWGGNSWIKVALFTSFLFPGTLIFGYIIVNIILTIEKSNASVHFSDIISLFVLWIFCTLVFLKNLAIYIINTLHSSLDLLVSQLYLLNLTM